MKTLEPVYKPFLITACGKPNEQYTYLAWGHNFDEALWKVKKRMEKLNSPNTPDRFRYADMNIFEALPFEEQKKRSKHPEHF